MSKLVVEPAAATPVFTDPTGRRARVLKALAWSLCASFVLVVGAVAFTLLTQVPLPGLGGLVPDRPDAAAPRTAPPPAVSRNHEPAVAGSPGESAPSSSSERAQGTRRAEPAPDRTAPAATVGTHHAAASNAAAATTAQGSTPAPQGNTTSPGPNANSNPQATTKTRNPQAAARKPSPRNAREPNAHAASGHGSDRTTDPAATPPGRTK